MTILQPDYTWSRALTKRGLSDITHIVLHHAAAVTATPEQIHSWHLARGWAGIGYHYYVRKDGSVYRGRPLLTVGAHVSGWNTRSVGVCCEGNFEKESMPAAQQEAVTELLCALLIQLPQAAVCRHRDLGATDCPGKNYPFEAIKKAALSRREENELTPEKFDELMKDYLERRASQAVPEGMKKSYDIAVALGITDGKAPRRFATRAEAAVMAYNAVLEALNRGEAVGG